LAVIMAVLLAGTAAASDPWKILQDKYPKESASLQSNSPSSKCDPWVKLRAIYLPFTEALEKDALTDTKARRKVSGHLNRVLRPYSEIIDDAAQRFNIPKEIIGAVIMVESGGDQNAKAKTSTASGLMQTVRGTFKEARQNLSSIGVSIANTPFDPNASIMAGSWYLDRMFEQAASDRKDSVKSRHDINSWRYPVEYYYAGPGNGKKSRPIVIIYANGRRIAVDKSAYSGKVLRWARIMSKAG